MGVDKLPKVWYNGRPSTCARPGIFVNTQFAQFFSRIFVYSAPLTFSQNLLYYNQENHKGESTMRHYHCPVNAWDCPYWQNGGICGLDDPMTDCDDFASVWDEDDEYLCDGGEDCAVWDKGE